MAGSSGPVAISASLRNYYSSIYVDSAADNNAYDEFNDLFTKLTNSINNNNNAMPDIDAELTEMCVKPFIFGKAAGADRLVAEHIVHAAPSLIIYIYIYIYIYNTSI